MYFQNWYYLDVIIQCGSRTSMFQKVYLVETALSGAAETLYQVGDLIMQRILEFVKLN